MYIHRLLNYQSFQKLLVYIATKRDNCHISNGEECFYRICLFRGILFKIPTKVRKHS